MRLKVFSALVAAFCTSLFVPCCSDTKEKSERNDYSTLETFFAAERFQKALRKRVNEMLGVTEMQRIIDNLSFVRSGLNESLLEDLTQKLDSEFKKYVTIINETQEYIARNCKTGTTECGCFHQQFLGFFLFPSLPECSTIVPTFLRYHEQFGTQVNVSYACCVLSDEAQHHICDRNLLYRNLTSVFQDKSRHAAIRWQYMANTAGVQIEYPAHVFVTARRRHWKPFLSAALPFKKRFLILLDTGTVQTVAQLKKLKSIAEIVLDAATPGDRLMIMAANGSHVLTPCASSSFLDSDAGSTEELTDFIKGLKFREQFNNNYSHPNALKAAYKFFVKDEELARESGMDEVFENVMFYISRGVMSDLNESISVLSALGEVAVKTSVRIKINTLAFSEGGRELMIWSASFLRNIAEQNYTKYKQSFSEALQNEIDNGELEAPTGKTLLVNGTAHTQLSLMKVFDLLYNKRALVRSASALKSLQWSHPFLESQSTLISLSKAVWNGDSLAAVVGMDINLGWIANIIKYRDEILMAPRKAELRLLLCDPQGRVLIDSRQPDAYLWPLHISELESWRAEDRWLSDAFASTDLRKGTFSVLKKGPNDKNFELRYSWLKLDYVPLVLVLGINASEREAKFSIPAKMNMTTSLDKNFVYHRFDLRREPLVHQCLHHGSVSSFQRGGVFLSPSCFDSPSVVRSVTLSQVNAWWVYLSGPSVLYSNVGIRRGVREHINILWKIINYWSNESVGLNDQVIRRYVATSRGVMLTYPATVVRADYEPTAQPWYNRAVKFPGRIVLTGPILHSEIGPVVTVSTAIFEGLDRSMHNSETDQIFAVIAMDIPAGFLAHLVRDNVPACKEKRRCIIFDDMGYVLTRGTETGLPARESKLSGRNTLADAVERFHVNHLEPQLATHLLAHPALVQKGQCVHWKTSSLERFFQFNVSFKDVLTLPCENIGSGLAMRTKSTRAEIISVSWSNMFLALMNESCSFAHQTFCPCSVTDRRCLLCPGFDKAECECPCQCPIPVDRQCQKLSDNSSANRVNVMPYSSLFSDIPVSECAEKLTLFYSRPQQKLALPDCVPSRCESYRNMDDCLVGIGCQWCATAEDGESLLEDAFCSKTDQCYGGVKGRRIRDMYGGSSHSAGQWSMATPVGAVAAGIMSVFLIMVMAVYCYRSQVNRTVETRSLMNSSLIPICPSSPEDDDFPFGYDEPAEDKIEYASFELCSDVRPVGRPQLRPSPRTESSDQGYSTMTDRMNGEESEGASSSINVSRRAERTMLMPMQQTSIAEDCANSITVKADVHHAPSPPCVAVS